jgi:hypothetical protein
LEVVVAILSATPITPFTSKRLLVKLRKQQRIMNLGENQLIPGQLRPKKKKLQPLGILLKLKLLFLKILLKQPIRENL